MMNPDEPEIWLKSRQTLQDWLTSCTRGGKLSRNTIAIGIVVLDHIRRTSPASRASVISPGGEVKGARSGLANLLAAYGIPDSYLKEATTRQGHQDGQRLFEALNWGRDFAGLTLVERDRILLELIDVLVGEAKAWLARQNLRLNLDRRDGPIAWVRLIMDNARERSGGVVEQHLVGAKLERRFRGISIPNHPAHAGDLQTTREGDFSIQENVYHVTASPSSHVIQKCAANLMIGKHPVLLVPRAQEVKAWNLAEDAGIDSELTIISLEGFIALNVVELATEENKDFFAVLQDIIDIYNRRLAEVETDLSLQIEIH